MPQRPATTPPVATIAAHAQPRARPFTPSARPRILSLHATPQIVHSGEAVSWDVRTSTDVVAVTASVAVYSFPLRRQAPGHFVLVFAIPKEVPGFFHGTYSLAVVARTNTGLTSSRIVALTFR